MKNGTTAEIVYKMGLTRINANQVELTPDTKQLGFTFDSVSNYVRGSLNLGDPQLATRTYTIGLVSKTNQNVKATADILVKSPVGFVYNTVRTSMPL